MKLIEILKAQGLTDEQINKITSFMKENKIYETSIEGADDLVKSFEGGLTKKEVENLKTEHSKSLEAKELGFKKQRLIQEKFSDIKEKDIRDYLISKIDLEKLTIKEDGTCEELDSQYKTIKESNQSFFNDETPSNTGGLGNFNRNTGGGGNIESSGERLAKQATETNANNHNYFGGGQ